jgi:cyclopropane-fatty-acyl-phospholipid synthase
MPITAALKAPLGTDTRHIKATVRIVKRLLHDFQGTIALRLWNGSDYVFGETVPKFTLVVRDPVVLRKLILKRNPITLVDAYFRGLVDFEGDLYAGLRLKPYLQKLSLPIRSRVVLVLDALRLPAQTTSEAIATSAPNLDENEAQKHSRLSDRAAISFHYDVSNAFYKLWLCDEMVYSCAYFETSYDSLVQAQRNKLDHICRKLRLKPSERFLDIGCGWGAMVCWAAQHYGVTAHGITLSQRQFDYATERVKKLGLQDLVTLELRDYRDLAGDGVYDKISSIGMFEHVGLANLPVYNATVLRLLRPGGLFLNHGITHDEEGWHPTLEAEFINRYVFPGGELDTISNILRGMEQANFEIHDVENLRMHYAMTLREWVKRLEANHDAALNYVSEDAYRVWRFYMAACAMEFEAEGTGIYQVLASKRGSHSLPVPLTRNDLYEPSLSQAALPAMS